MPASSAAAIISAASRGLVASCTVSGTPGTRSTGPGPHIELEGARPLVPRCGSVQMTRAAREA